MSQIIPIYIPRYISSINYNPARVLPRLFFYNGQVDCENWYIADENNSARTQTAFPYFDYYNVVTGSFPTTDSESLLFNNETPVYGEVPTDSLYTNYWETYVSLLYNPKTRLINANAIIPFADYTELTLNDIIEWRGNYYHLRAINDYSVKTGECKLQLLGPIISDTFGVQATPTPPVPPTGSTAYATASIHLQEYNSSPTFLDANLIVSGTAYYFSGDFTQSISGGAVANVVMEGKDAGSTTWGSYTTASATLTIKDNGTLVTSSTQYIYSGSGDTVITIPTTFTAGHNITISGSTLPVTGSTPPPPSGSAMLDWTFSVTGTSSGTMDIYVNGTNVESRNATSSGTETGLLEGDEIYVEIITGGCSGGSIKANAYCIGVISDASCSDNFTDLVSYTYTVTSGDLGTTLSIDCFALCDSGCV